MSQDANKSKSTFFTSQRLKISICLGISLVAWLLVKLSKDYTHQYNFVVKYNVPIDMTMGSPPIKYVTAQIHANGWSLLRMTMSKEDDTLRVALRESTQQISSQMALSSTLHRTISDQIEIYSIEPVQVAVPLVKMHQKKIPISLIEAPRLSTFYHLRGPIKFTPDSILIFGAESALEQVSNWTIDLDLPTELSSDYEEEVSIEMDQANALVSSSIKKVSVLIPIEELTEKEIIAPIKVVDSLFAKVQIFPDKARIKCLVGLSEYDDLIASDFLLIAHPSSFTSQNKSYRVSIRQQPKHATVLEYTPMKVEYFLVNP